MEWIERDRREPDKVLLHVSSIKSLLIRREVASGEDHDGRRTPGQDT